jgi:hypothetical protein
MYRYMSGYADEEVYIAKGQVMGGLALGIILFGHESISYPLLPGSVENASTFCFPIHFKAIPSASIERVVSPKLDSGVLQDLIDTAKEMEQQGCRAIIGGCGYFGNYQPQVAAAINVPCFLSSIIQVPIILRSLKPDQKVGIVCANGSVLSSAPVLGNCGVDPTSVVIAGSETLPEMQKIYQNLGHYNPAQLGRELVELTKKMVSDNPDIGAILLECTLFPTYGWDVQKAVNLPVWDFTTLINWVYNAVVRRPFAGFM